eukprot:6209990-Pleurochrysis_carterae.AAC.1
MTHPGLRSGRGSLDIHDIPTLPSSTCIFDSLCVHQFECDRPSNVSRRQCVRSSLSTAKRASSDVPYIVKIENYTPGAVIWWLASEPGSSSHYY